MADSTLSGYKVAAQSIAWASGQTLDSLTDNEWTDLSDAIDNSIDKRMLADVELVLGSAAFNGTDSDIDLYLIPSVDGTNYPNWTGNSTVTAKSNHPYFVGRFVTTGTTAAQRMIVRDVSLPNGLYKYAFRNKGNVTLAASGNTAKWRPHQYAG